MANIAHHTPDAAPALSVATAVMNGEPCLDAASLAALLGCAPHHVLHQLAKRMDFPCPLVDVSCRVRYWRAVDVLLWLYQTGTTRAMGLADLAAPRLDAAGLADLLGCTRQHAADHIATRADFPPPCINVSRRRCRDFFDMILVKLYRFAFLRQYLSQLRQLVRIKLDPHRSLKRLRHRCGIENRCARAG